MPVGKGRSWSTEQPYKAAQTSIVTWTGRKAGSARQGEMRERKEKEFDVITGA